MPDKIPPTALGQNQNLINQIRIEKVEPLAKPKGSYKPVVLDALGVVLAAVTGYAYFQFLGGAWPLLVPVGAFFALTIVTALESLLDEKIARRIGVIVIEVAALLAPFYASGTLLLGICAAVGEQNQRAAGIWVGCLLSL